HRGRALRDRRRPAGRAPARPVRRQFGPGHGGDRRGAQPDDHCPALSDPAASPCITRAGGTFRAAPWSGAEPAAGWGEVFAVFAGDDPAAPAMLGAYARDGDAVAFTPRFAPAPGLRLRAVYRPPGADVVTARFGGVPVPPRAPTTRVLSVTPSAEIWPENILKLYITFSAPMRIGVAWDNIRIKDANGAVLGGLFVEIDQELWDTEGRRLTVL